MNVTNTGAAPAPAAAPPTNPKGELGKQEFLQLLVTQLRHQDPLNPSDPQDFAAQLAQFSSLEQLVNIGGALEEQQAVQQAMIELTNASSALGVLGREIIAAGDTMRVDASGNASVSFEAQSGGTGSVQVIDAATGEVVATVDLGSVEQGRQTVDLDAAELDLPEGDYRFAVEVTDANGEDVPVTTLVTGRVDGIRYSANGPLLVCGSMQIPLSAVVEVNTIQQES